jgi:hypothetical protein
VAGVTGVNTVGEGVHGETSSDRWSAVVGIQMNETTDNAAAGIWGASKRGQGVHGETSSDRWSAVVGIQMNETTDNNVPAVWGESKRGEGVHGETSSDRFAGVVGVNTNANGDGEGVYGESRGTGAGVLGIAKGSGIAVQGETSSGTEAGVVGVNTNANGDGEGVYGESRGTGAGVLGIAKGTGPAGFFSGNVEVTGDIRLLGSDCAEEFDISYVDKVEPGTVMVLSSSEGALEPSSRAYDKRVAGVTSGAAGFKPGIILDKKQLQESNKNGTRMPVALVGKVYCKVDADYSPIEVGDLLTTSPTEGHAMKASDPIKAFGSVIGKALRSLKEGKELIPILISMQ